MTTQRDKITKCPVTRTQAVTEGKLAWADGVGRAKRNCPLHDFQERFKGLSLLRVAQVARRNRAEKGQKRQLSEGSPGPRTLRKQKINDERKGDSDEVAAERSQLASPSNVTSVLISILILIKSPSLSPVNLQHPPNWDLGSNSELSDTSKKSPPQFAGPQPAKSSEGDQRTERSPNEETSFPRQRSTKDSQTLIFQDLLLNSRHTPQHPSPPDTAPAARAKSLQVSSADRSSDEGLAAPLAQQPTAGDP